MESQRIVIIQDASKEVYSNAIQWAFKGLSLKPGDDLTLLGVLHQDDISSLLPPAGAGKSPGNKNRGDSSTMWDVNHKLVKEAVARKKEEYGNNVEVIQISKMYELQKVAFGISVVAGPSPKVVALEAAQNLRATWVILDRHMKREKKFFLEKLSCGLSRMKSNNRIEKLRGPKVTGKNKLATGRSHTSSVTYSEMLSESLEEDEDDLFSIELFPSRQTADLMIQEQGRPRNSSNGDITEMWTDAEIFENSVCSVCKSRRPKIGWAKDFTHTELQDATNGFSPKNILSEDEFCSVFKGQLKNKLNIIVKRYKDARFQEAAEICVNANELMIKATHKNVAMLLGSCVEGSDSLLVYEYSCGGLLDQLLSEDHPAPLTWTQRMKVALCAARGVKHLHENDIIHGNLRPNNILVNHNHEAMIADLGLARRQWESDHNRKSRITMNSEYLPPEYIETGRLSTMTDTYSFGVVLLEIITGRRSKDEAVEEESLLKWANPLLRERKYLELIDSRIFDARGIYEFFWIVKIIEKCIIRDPNKRLSMDNVVFALEYISERHTSGINRDFSSTKSDYPKMDNSQIHETSLAAEAESHSRSLSTRFSINKSTKKSSTVSEKSNKKKMAKTRSMTQIHYDEMLI